MSPDGARAPQAAAPSSARAARGGRCERRRDDLARWHDGLERRARDEQERRHIGHVEHVEHVELRQLRDARLLATRVLGRRPAPAWILSLHRYLGALAVAFLGVHVGALLVDNYTNFTVVNVLVPFTGSWDPVAVAWGIVGMYLLLAIEITSLVRDRLSVRSWRVVHLASYFLFATATIHMLTAGTDVKAVVAASATVLLGVMVAFGSIAAYLWRSEPRARTRPL
jgi:hypothetical protein